MKLLSSPESAEVDPPDFMEAEERDEREEREVFLAASFFRASIFSVVDEGAVVVAVVSAEVIVTVNLFRKNVKKLYKNENKAKFSK